MHIKFVSPRFHVVRAGLRSWFAAAAALLSAGSVGAAPVPYSYNDSGAGGYAGIGVFTLDVSVPLMDYDATAVSGDGTTFGPWSAVTFQAHAGDFPSLVISNLAGASLTLSLPGIGGSDIQVGSQADLEWAHFLVEAEQIGFRIAPVVTEEPQVPEASTWISVAVLGGGAVAQVIRRRVRKTSHGQS